MQLFALAMIAVIDKPASTKVAAIVAMVIASVLDDVREARRQR